MQLTILGCHGPYAPANGACSGYLVETEKFRVMIDCGNGSFSQLQKYVDFNALDILVITHLHPDHYLDIYCLRQAIKAAMATGQRKEPVFLYLPNGPEGITEEIRSWKDEFYTVSLEEACKKNNNFDEFTLEFFKNKHSAESYGVKVNQGGKTLTYTSDTGWSRELVEHCQNTDLLLVEASLKESELAERGDHHMTAKQAGLLGQSIGVSELILTHFFPMYNQNQLKREAEYHFEGKVHLAKQGKKYTL